MPFADRSRSGWWHRTRLLCRYCKAAFTPRDEPFPQLHCGEKDCQFEALKEELRLQQERLVVEGDRWERGNLAFSREELVQAREAYL